MTETPLQREVRMRKWQINGLIGSLRMAEVALNRVAQLEKLNRSERFWASHAAAECALLIENIRKTYFKKYGAKSEPAPVEA